MRKSFDVLYNEFMLDDIDENEDLYVGEIIDMEKMPENVGDECDVTCYDWEEPTATMHTKPQQDYRAKYNVPDSSDYDNQLSIGILVETEHLHWWSDENPDISYDTLEQIATNIAIDHLNQDPKYYTKLIQAGLVDEQEAIDLHKSIYGDTPTEKKKPLPLPKNDVGENVKRTFDYSDTYKADVTLEPIKTISNIQPTGITETKKSAYTDYEDMLGQESVGYGNYGDETFDVDIDDLDVGL